MDKWPKAKEEATSRENAQKLQQTDGRTVEALKNHLRELASKVEKPEDKISERDIDQAAFHIALRAEEAGQPLTYESVTATNEQADLGYIDSLGLRLNARPAAPEAPLDHAT